MKVFPWGKKKQKGMISTRALASLSFWGMDCLKMFLYQFSSRLGFLSGLEHIINQFETARMLYHQTKDILYVMNFPGHKKLDTTLLYIQIEQALFKETDDEVEVMAVKILEEIKSLLEVGFEYVCQKDGVIFFRKCK